MDRTEDPSFVFSFAKATENPILRRAGGSLQCGGEWAAKGFFAIFYIFSTPGEVRQRNDNQWPNSYFCHYCGWNIFKMKLESLSFRDSSGIQSEKRLSSVAELRYTMLYGKSQFNEREYS